MATTYSTGGSKPIRFGFGGGGGGGFFLPAASAAEAAADAGWESDSEEPLREGIGDVRAECEVMAAAVLLRREFDEAEETRGRAAAPPPSLAPSRE